MDWLAWVFVYSNGNAWIAAQRSTFVLSFLFTLLLPKLPWGVTGVWAAFVVFVVFSVMLTVFNGVRSTAPIGGMHMIFYVTLVAFPTAAIVRLVMRLVGRLKRAE